MRLVLFLFFFLIVACGNKQTYLCDGRKCINNKEVDEYFAKNLSLEVEVYEKKNEKDLDLISLNTNNNEKNYKIKRKNLSNKELKSLKKNEIKERLKEQKRLTKLKKAREKEKRKIDKIRINNEKKLAKLKKKKNINKTKPKTVVNIPKDDEEFKTICLILEKCDIDAVLEHLTIVGKSKSYPEINIK